MSLFSNSLLLFCMCVVAVRSLSVKNIDDCSVTSALSRAFTCFSNRQPEIPRLEQDIAAQAKLDAFIASNNNKKPNFLWFVVDDLGYGDIGGLWGGGSRIGAATPNINALSQGGLSLMATYSQPTCTPTRAGMMTGRLPYRTGLVRPILAGDSITSNPWSNESSVALQLSDGGYYTILTGKWHTGEVEGTRPFDVGFDEFLGYYTSQKEITQKFDKRRYPDLVLNEDLLSRFNSISDRIGMYHGFKQNGSEEVEHETTSREQFAEADQILAQFTIDKIVELSSSNTPFFISHNFMRCHADNIASGSFEGSSASKYPFKDNLVEVDSIVGRIMDTLSSSGVLNNTFVFFTSDNGPQMDSWPDSGYTPFRGGKSTTWEGGIRVPGIAYWDGMIKGGRVSDELFDLMDLYNTVLNIAGVDMDSNLAKLPVDLYVDGIDQTSFLLDDEGQSKREQIYSWIKGNFMALRLREYKYHMKVVKEENPLQLIDYSRTSDVGMAAWLYNLYIDPKESLPVGHRRNAWLATFGKEATQHAATFVDYPPKDIGLA